MADSKRAVIIGGGPAGLFAASLLTEAGIGVDLYERKGSPGRKFLLAGQSGLNLTNDESPELMAERYGRSREMFLSLLEDFSSRDMRQWFAGLGVDTCDGSGGKIFPRDRTPREILSLLLDKLERSGIYTFHAGYDWKGWSSDGLVLVKDDSEVIVRSKPVLFALGGASWPSTGSDGAWRDHFREKAIETVPFRPMNCGFLVDWSSLFRDKFADRPVKNIALELGGERKRGDFLVTEKGLEGGPVYWFSLPLRERLEREGRAEISVDLIPDLSLEKITSILGRKPGKKSLSSFLKSTGRLSPIKISLLLELTSPEERSDPGSLAQKIKRLPLSLRSPGCIEKAISSSGGVAFRELNDYLMIKSLPGCFTAGEMIDWEAPTGGYMMQGCFATAKRAVRGMGEYLK